MNMYIIIRQSRNGYKLAKFVYYQSNMSKFGRGYIDVDDLYDRMVPDIGGEVDVCV